MIRNLECIMYMSPLIPITPSFNWYLRNSSTVFDKLPIRGFINTVLNFIN